MITERDFTRIKNDVNGNPRYVIHFLACLPDSIKNDYKTMTIVEKYRYSIELMRKIGGRKYHTKGYGGGIVFQSYSLPNLIKSIEELINNI